MYRAIAGLLVGLVCLSVPPGAFAEQLTGETGGGQPFSNIQPSTALNHIIALQGIYPSRSSLGEAQTLSATDPFLGEISVFAGNFAPRGWAFCNGQLLPISQNQALFSLLGITYGGDGRTTFALPNLQGRISVGEGYGPGLSHVFLGEQGGTEQVTLTEAQLPVHAHTLPSNLLTEPAGGGQPHTNRQPYLGTNYIIALEGVYPSRDSLDGPQLLGLEPFIGEVSRFAGNFAPQGWAPCEGQLLPISQYSALFSLLGTTYGGDGRTTFALPDLRGRVPVHTGQGTDWRLGEARGTEYVSLTVDEMASHVHGLPSGGDTGSAGGGQAHANTEPSLGLNYIIALEGVYPSRDSLGDVETLGLEPFLGEIGIFAGNFAPRGWAFCDGQLLPISQNDALFSLLGTTYGGNGMTTFALPDLRGRAAVHAGLGPGLSWALGERRGAEEVFLSVSQLPAHSHVVPEPSVLTLALFGLPGLLLMACGWRRKWGRPKSCLDRKLSLKKQGN